MFVIIMPVYNTEKYLEEAIESILHQTLSFEENVFLHLVDDASSDGSLSVCRKYEKAYPNNIEVTHFEKNQGVSHARNSVLDRYREDGDVIVGFVDSDDKLEADVLEKVTAYYEKHPDIALASVEIRYFDAVDTEHKLNWRFREREVVDILEDYTFPQYYAGGVFVRGRALSMLRFDESMSFWEDAMAVNQVILEEGKYGLIGGAVYFYRKRPDDSSLVNQAWRDKSRYTSFLEEGYVQIMKYCRRKKRCILPYIQFLVAYHMRMFMMNSKAEVVSAVLTEEETVELRKHLRKILKKIKEDVIISLPTSLPIIESMLSIRKGKQVRVKRVYTEDDCLFCYRGKVLARMSERRIRLYRWTMKREGYEGFHKGQFMTPVYAMHKEDYIFAERDGVQIRSQELRCRENLIILGKRLRCYYHAMFAINLPDDWDKFKLGIHMDEGNVDVYMHDFYMNKEEDPRFADLYAEDEAETTTEEGESGEN